MKNVTKFVFVLFGFNLALIASSNELNAQKTGKKKKHHEGCVGTGICGKTKAGKEVSGQFRVW